MKKRVAIVGAGPIGLEAALLATDRGHPVIVFERGEVGDSIRRWGHVRMFTPFAMNVSVRGIERLRQAGKTLPDPDAMLTGTEYVAQYLLPLADSLGESIRTNAEVTMIGRSDLMRHEMHGDPERGEAPFRILLRRGDREWHEEAGMVLDCTGNYLTPNHLGDGGMPALGEGENKGSIIYGVADVLGRLRWMFENRKIMVIGAGHSAATAIRDLAALRRTAPETSVTWVARGTDLPPYRNVADDPLPERDAIMQTANKLAASGSIDFRRGCTVLAISPKGAGLEVTLTGCSGPETVFVDRIIAAVGFRPNLELTRELQLNPPSLREALIGGITAPETNGDQPGADLKRWSGGVEALRQPEPDFFVLGAKSFGREGAFFIRDGRNQVEAVFNCVDAGEVSGASLAS